MNSIISLFLRVGALTIFVLCLIGYVQEAQKATYMICGWSALICANLEDIKEILKNDRNTKHDCNRDRVSD